MKQTIYLERRTPKDKGHVGSQTHCTFCNQFRDAGRFSTMRFPADHPEEPSVEVKVCGGCSDRNERMRNEVVLARMVRASERRVIAAVAEMLGKSVPKEPKPKADPKADPKAELKKEPKEAGGDRAPKGKA